MRYCAGTWFIYLLPMFPALYKVLGQHPVSVRVAAQVYSLFFLPSQSWGAPGKIIKIELSGRPNLGKNFLDLYTAGSITVLVLNSKTQLL